MKVVHLDCERCGAPLEAQPKLERVRCEFCGAEVLVQHETPAPAPAPAAAAAHPQTEAIRELDEAWRIQREGLEVQGKDGRYARPTRGMAILVMLSFGGISLVAFLMFQGFGAAASGMESMHPSRPVSFTGPNGQPLELEFDDFENGRPLGGRIARPSSGIASMIRWVSFFPLLIFVVGIASGVLLLKKARAFDEAENTYRKRRRQLMRDADA